VTTGAAESRSVTTETGTATAIVDRIQCPQDLIFEPLPPWNMPALDPWMLRERFGVFSC
jgi:hypothetical protein